MVEKGFLRLLFTLFISSTYVYASGYAQAIARVQGRVNSQFSTTQYPAAPIRSTFTDFCGDSHYLIKRATKDEIGYKGNTGTEASYGCNMMLVWDSVTDRYDHTINLTNALNQDQWCACWLKIGPDGGINGFFEGNQVLNLTCRLN
ncbi:hypothetical protein V8C42DRAFT_74739 [Trichoderma barbatum]